MVVVDGISDIGIKLKISKKEVEKVLKIKNNKATRHDNIPIDALKSLGEEVANIL